MSDDIFERFNCAIEYKNGEKETNCQNLRISICKRSNCMNTREINQTEREQYNYAVCKNMQ